MNDETNLDLMIPGRTRGVRGTARESPVRQSIRDTAAAMQFDPIRLSIDIIRSGKIPVVDPETGEKKYKTLKAESIMRELRDLRAYMFPRMSAIQVTGLDDNPVHVASFNIDMLLSDPALMAALQKVAFLAQGSTDKEERRAREAARAEALRLTQERHNEPTPVVEIIETKDDTER